MKKLIIFLSLISFSVYSGPYTVCTWVGNGTAGDKDGLLNEARFNKPVGLCRDNDGNFYVSEWENNKIRKVTPEGEVTTFASSVIAGYGEGSSRARLNQPFGVCVDNEGNVYVGDFLSNSVLKITSSGDVSTLAGGGEFSSPRGVDVDNEEKCVYVGDSWNHRIKRIDLNTSQVTTYAGGGATGTNAGDLVDAQGDAARFHTPCGVRLDTAGNVYVADAFNHRIRKIDKDQNVTTVAGTGPTGDGNGGFQNGDSSEVLLNTPTKLFITKPGIIIIGDLYNHLVRKVDTDYSVSTLAGTGEAGHKDGPDSLAEFDWPRGIVADDDLDSIYVADCNNHCIRLIWRKEQTAATSEKSIKPKAHRIFLNSTRDILSIELFQVKGAFNIDIFNICGKLMYRKGEITKTQLKVPVMNFISGAYIIKIKSENQEIIRTMIIDR